MQTGAARREPTVLVACSQAWDAPGRFPGLLARAGCRVDVMCPTTSALFHTRYATGRHEGPDDDLAAFLRAFARLRRERNYDAVIAVDDFLLDALENGPPDELRPWFPVDPASDGFDLLRGKVGFCRTAQRWGLSIPRSAVAHTFEEAARAAEQIGYPVVLKRDISYAGLGVRPIETPERLARAYKHLADERPCVVQEMIDGPIGNTAALLVQGKPVAWMTAYKSRTWPRAFGPSSARQFVDRPEMAAVLSTIGRRTGYHGFLALDWIERHPATGRHRGDLAFIELNARPVPAIQMAPRVGVDFTAAIPALFGAPVSVQIPRVTDRAASEVLPMFPQDFFRAIARRERDQLDAWATGADPFDDVPWDDPSLIAWHTRSRSIRRHFDRVFASRLRS